MEPNRCTRCGEVNDTTDPICETCLQGDELVEWFLEGKVIDSDDDKLFEEVQDYNALK